MGFLKTSAAGDRVPFNEGGNTVYTEDITAAKTLTIEDSGKCFALKAAAGVAITLPAVTAGASYRFVVGLAFATTAWTITSATNVIQGTVIVNGASVLGSNENTISFVETAENLGDFVDLWSDGTNWYVSGVGSAIGAITLTVV